MEGPLFVNKVIITVVTCINEHVYEVTLAGQNISWHTWMDIMVSHFWKCFKGYHYFNEWILSLGTGVGFGLDL